MQTKGRKEIDIILPDVKALAHARSSGQSHTIYIVIIALAVLLALATGLVMTMRSRDRFADTVEQQQQTLQSLEQQAQTVQSQLQELQDQNATLQSDADRLKAEADRLKQDSEALKAEIAKHGLQFPASVYEGRKLIALTFDDGPGAYTEELLDFLKEQNVRATFFLLGTNVSRYSALVKRMDEEGHAIGNHSYNHPTFTKLSASGVANQIAQCNAAIKTATGHTAAVLRCPGGSQNATVRKQAGKAGLPLIHWSLDTLDWKLRDKDKILTRVFEEVGVKDGDIVLMHDIHRESVDAVKEMIIKLQAEEYMFVTVPELLSVREGGMQAGELYDFAGK